MIAARAVAFLTAHVPLRHLLGRDLVVRRVTAVAGWTCRPLHLIRRIELSPPIRARFDVVLPPDLVQNVPLRRVHEVVVADLREVALLPLASVGEDDVILAERDQRIGRLEVAHDDFWVLLDVHEDVRHQRLSPALVDLGMTALARLRPDERAFVCGRRNLPETEYRSNEGQERRSEM